MIYIAESGSTKCDHVILKEDGTVVASFKTQGFNPQFHSSNFINSEMLKVEEVVKFGSTLQQVHFFGAGCSSPELKQKVLDGLSGVFPNATIDIDHDLMASAYATYGGSPAITCILGTGSNTVFFDGKDIIKGIAGTGYILGDEGSASYIGKKVLSGYLYKTMPKTFSDDFDALYNLSRSEILKQVYEMPNANVFIASFSRFAYKHIEVPFFRNLVYEGFHSFIQTQVLYFEKAKDVPIHFVGSVAFHYQEILQEVISDMKLQMGTVVQSPIDGLIHYYLNNQNI